MVIYAGGARWTKMGLTPNYGFAAPTIAVLLASVPLGTQLLNEPPVKSNNKHRWLIAIVVIFGIAVAGFGVDRYFRVPRLRAERPEETSARWQVLLKSSTIGGVKVHSYRARLKKSPLPKRLHEAGIPETGPLILNGTPLEMDQWVEITLSEPLPIQRKGDYLPLDLRHPLADGPAILDLEIRFGDAQSPKTLKLPGVRINSRRHF